MTAQSVGSHAGSYPGIERERRIPYLRLEALVAAIFRGCGCTEADATRLAEIIAGTDARGVHSHGVALVPTYARRLRAREVDPTARPKVSRDSGAALVVDGANAMGHLALDVAMRATIDRARSSGVASAAIGGSNHCGAMAYYAMLALPEDMIGIVTTNGLPTMAPWGSRDRILSINPIAVAIPAGAERPIVLDTSFGAAARSKIVIYQQKGERLPAGWAVDKDGNPTTDPAAALEGLIVPAGGHKGTGLALIMGILSTALSGALYGTVLGSLERGPVHGRDGQFAIALDVRAFEDVRVFKDRVDEIIREIHGSRPAPGFDRVLAPGEDSAETEIEYRERGVPLNDVTLRQLAETARACEVEADLVAEIT
ncbi:MAG TPA: Ldh family oxidoreductase [Candidatus Limnocylindria bacterium]|nr:Ldh family oxidoreductase [Candidatus Limnocylindria bacterium]